MAGKCAKCERIVNEAKLEHMDLSDGHMRIRAFSASCPFCGTTMGVVIDPRPLDEKFAAISRVLNIR